MFAKFNYIPSNSFYNMELNKCQPLGCSIYSKHENEVKECLSEFITEDGIINGTALKEHWFSISKKDVFISHSHKDINKVKAFAGWLNQTFGLEAFIDSCAWGYCDDLLRKIDDKYCYNAKTNTYNYNLRNYTTSHVHMMLSTALTEMIDNTECIIFFNTPNSINLSEELDNVKGKQSTISPWIDNYFNVLHSLTTQNTVSPAGNTFNANNADNNHGIGLFDTIQTKNEDGSESKIWNFTLTGSVNTEIYSNTYSALSQELSIVKSADSRFLSVGGAVGTAKKESVMVFDQITLRGLSVCGSCVVGGIVGYSCNDTGEVISFIRCQTDDSNGLSIKMNCGSDQDNDGKSRNAIGGFIGKCFQGKINIYGTTAKENNTTLSNFSTVKLDFYGFEQPDEEYRACAGGLVGFAGDGCQAYDMYVVSGDSAHPVTIGGSMIRFAGGICGAMQSMLNGAYEKAEGNHAVGDLIENYEPTCYAVFKNCTVENINIKGQFVGGFYGGKWGTTSWTPYSITIDSCKVIGNPNNNNVIQAYTVYSGESQYAGGFIGRGLVLANGNPTNILILVDPNGNADRMYYASNMNDFDAYVDPENMNENRLGWRIELDKFKDSSGNAFSVRTLNDLIAKDIIESSTGTLLYKDGTENDHDVYRILPNGSFKYYKYTNSGDGIYHLSVGNNYVLNEDYYITMFVPMSNDLFFYEIIAPDELQGVKTVNVIEGNVFTVIAANLYTQTTPQLNVLPDDQQINASNKTVYVRPSVSIEISNPDAKAYLGAGVELYHSFNLSLDRHYENWVTNEIIGLNENSIIATYNIGSAADENSTAVLDIDLQKNYLNIETAEIMSQLIAAANREEPLEIYSYVELNFEESKLEDEFPQKDSEATIGMNVTATTNLAYEEERLSYTSMSIPFLPDGHYYFRESLNSAKLDYNATVELDEYDAIGNISQNQSRLGVNGFPENCSQLEYMPIDTEAKYNVSAISDVDLARAESVRLTVTLSKKTDHVEDGVVTGVEYIEVSNLLSYIDSGIHIASGTLYGTGGEGVTHTIAAGASSLTVVIPKANCFYDSGVYSFDLAFKAKTGEYFTEYANYKITLSVELIYVDNGQTKVVENSGISDYIVYTNAKVYPSVIVAQS